MDFGEYNRAEKQNYNRFFTFFSLILRPFQQRRLTKPQWNEILDQTFEVVDDARFESARLARDFYDSERERVLDGPEKPPEDITAPLRSQDTRPRPNRLRKPQRHDILLPAYKPEWFREAMEPERKDFSDQDTTDTQVIATVARAAKEVYNGGRRTTLTALQSDTRVRGWARVEGGGESCGFCAMLISRGPVYKSAESAGFRKSDEDAILVWKAFEQSGDDDELMGLMAKWHPNCDCRVVPVFDLKNWPGRDQYISSRQLWDEVTKNEGGGFGGGDKLLAFRRALGDGYKNPNPRRY